MLVRHSQIGDGAAIARIQAENSAFYAALAPDLFNLPQEEGLVEFMEPKPDDNSETRLQIVAELDGEIVGVLEAALLEPDETAEFQSPSDLRELRLFINAVGVLQNYWRQGIATALVQAAEDWGRTRKATVSLCDTWPESPVSAPFWERRMGYTPRSMRMRKPL